ncbi:MAG TPA: hypothetical protein VLE73_00875 [Candidatus Saccharimonadales bacterium]|nr:hypothetical protein [Candidatus Saccharimonadales bacterium]
MGVVLLGIILHILLGSADVANSFSLRLFCWTLLGLAAAAFVYRTLLPRLFIRKFHYRIKMVTTPAKGVTRIVMEPVGRPMPFTSGQFVFVSFRLRGFPREWHPFSISSNSADYGLALTVKALGSYTTRLTSIGKAMNGTDVWIEGAYGRFAFKNFSYKRQVWVAGGIGITPFLSMIPEVTRDYQVDLYYSVKSADELMDWRFLQHIANSSEGNVRVIPIITDHDGFLTGKKITELSGQLAGCDILLCGPPPMMHALTAQLRAQGVAKKHIHSEEFAMS